MDRFLLYRTYDELEVGQAQRTRGRTITETDIVNWCALTGDWFYPHIDRVAAERSMFGQRVAPGIMVFALGTGLAIVAPRTIQTKVTVNIAPATKKTRLSLGML